VLERLVDDALTEDVQTRQSLVFDKLEWLSRVEPLAVRFEILGICIGQVDGLGSVSPPLGL
jgi:hypothetical protein